MDNTKDLEITFEAKLKFTIHINNTNQASWIYASIYRITKEIRYPALMKQLFNIYVRLGIRIGHLGLK